MTKNLAMDIAALRARIAQVTTEAVHRALAEPLPEPIDTCQTKAQKECPSFQKFPTLFQRCGDLTPAIGRAIQRVLPAGWIVQVESGTWTKESSWFQETFERYGGPASQMYAHNWLVVKDTNGGLVLKLDPTYTQFMGSNIPWSFEECVKAGVYCKEASVSEQYSMLLESRRM